MAFASMQSRPYPTLNTPAATQASNTSSSTVKSPLGNGAGPWGNKTASIWGSTHVPSNGSSRVNDKEPRKLDFNQNHTNKQGSGSLLGSSQTDWSARSRSEARPSLNTHHSNRAGSIDHVHSFSSITPTISPTTTRAPTINLTNPSFPSKSAFDPPHLYTSFGSEAPTVYPKNKDRSYPSTYTPVDSVIDQISATTSPINERRPQWPNQYSNGNSAVTSRDGSRAPQHIDRQQFGQHGDMRTKSTGYTARNGSLSPLDTMNDFSSSFNNLNMGNDRRPSSSRGLPPGTRLITDDPMADAGPELMKGLEHLLPQATLQYGMPFTGTSGQQALAHPMPNRQVDVSQYFQLQNFHNNQSKRQQDWQEADELAVALRPQMTPEQQYLFDPRLAQMMALKNPYFHNGLTAPITMTSLQAFPWHPAGLGAVPMESPAPQVEANLQSAKLFDFKMAGKNTRRYELRDIYEHIAEFAGDQHGSRFIQTKLETANSDEKERVFREIEPNAIPLMTDVFGNYVIQKFFDHGHQEHKRILAQKMRGQVLALSTQMYGCRVVQKALEHVLLEQQAALVNELKHHVLKCVKDQNGNHVIQKVIERCSAESISFVYDAFIGQVHSLSLHPYGCRVIQRCLERTEWFAAKPTILAELHEGVPKGMIGDSYGNYVVQHIVQNGPEEDRRFVLGIVLADVESFSKHKFASNVVEKCIEYSDDAWRRRVVDIFTKTDHRRTDNESILVGLIKDQYGNYVIQRLLDQLLMQDYIFFHHQLQPAMAQAKRTGSGKQVVSIEKKMQKFDFVPVSHETFQPTAPPTFASPFTAMSHFGGHGVSVMHGMNGDTVEGATSMSRNNSEAFGEHIMGRL